VSERERVVLAVREAGALAMRHFRKEPGRWEKRPGAVVTEVDLGIDRLLHAALVRPGDAWLSEESPDDPSRREAGRVWIVDPLDGTRGYVDGIPEFAVSVALIEGGEVVLGVILNPATDELFLAEAGGPATCNDLPLRVVEAPLAGARLVASRRGLRRHGIAPPQDVRLGRSASLAYALAGIALGRSDGLLTFRRSFDWDVAAALVILEAAGGRLTDLAGGRLRLNRPEPRHGGLIAAAPGLHRALLALAGGG
jgi:myo-inositol-1(or 4)-monophosphatase